MKPKISNNPTTIFIYPFHGKRPIFKKTLSLTLLIGCVVIMGGCAGNLYLHNNTRQKAAEDSQVAFNKIKEKAGYQQLLSSYDEQSVAQMELSQLIIDDAYDVNVSTLHDMFWGTLVDDTKSEFDSAVNNLKQAIKNKSTIEKELSDALTNLPTVQKKTLSFIGMMNEAAITKARSVATQQLLQESLLLILKKENDNSETPNTDRFNKVLNKTVKVTKFTKPTVTESSPTNNLGLIEKNTDIKISKLLGINLPLNLLTNGSQSTGIQEFVKETLSNFNDLSQLIPTFALQFKDPGITLTIIGFLQEIARAEEERIGVEINYAKQMVNLHGDYISFLKQHRDNLCEDLDQPSCKNGVGIITAGVNPDITVGATFSKLSGQCQKSDRRGESEYCLTLRAFYRVLAFNFENRIVAKNQGNLLETKIFKLKVQKTLADTQINILEREAAISRGLDGLVSFHSGGIDAEDIRNLIGIAQSIGVLVIAGGVL